MPRRLTLGLTIVLALVVVWWAVGPRSEPAPRAAREPAPEKPLEEEWHPVHEEVAPSALWEGTVAVHVVSERDGQPVPGARVQARVTYPDLVDEADVPLVQEARTDAQGVARLPRPRRSVTWAVRKPGFRVAWPKIDNSDDAPRVALVPAPPLEGRVIEAGTGTPLEGARVRAYWVDYYPADADLELVTGHDGGFVLAGVPANTLVEVVVASDGYGTVARELGRGDQVTLELGAGSDIRGMVKDASGSPVVGADVFVAERGAPTPLRPERWEAERRTFRRTRAITGADGRYLIRGVSVPAVVEVYARAKDGAEGRSKPLSLPGPGGSHDLDVTVAALGAITVSFVDARTRVRVSPHATRCSLDVEWGYQRDDQRATDDEENGVARFEGVPAGKHVVHVLPDFYLTPAPVSVELRPGKETQVEVALDPGLTVTGRVVDLKGRPLGVYVLFRATYNGVEQYPDARTDDAGRFTLRAVPPVAGELSASDSGVELATWKAVTIRGDLGDLVVGPGPRLVGRVPEAYRGAWLELGVLSIQGGSWSSSRRASEDGSFRIGLSAGKRAHVFIGPKGAAPLVLRDLVLAAGEERDLGEVTFPAPCTLEGTVLGADGRPVRLALVRTVEFWCDDRQRTDAQGRFRLQRLPPGASTLWIEPAPHSLVFRPVAITEGMAPMTIRLPRPGRLNCRFATQDGEPLAHAPVNVFRLLDNDSPDWMRRVIVHTDSRGKLDLVLYPGPYGVRPHAASDVELVGAEPHFTVKPGAVVELDLAVE